MQAPFLGNDFLLDTPQAQRLYHEIAADLPVIDFHNHLDPASIAGNRTWESIGEIWLEGDHYKWRAMRWNGISEDLITGPASYREKFDAFAETVPHCLGNPLYHWTHLELRRYFGWEGVFGPDTAEEVWELANAALSRPSHAARGLLSRFKVEYVGTTDDPTDDLAHHKAVAADAQCEIQIAPSFRPDKALVPSSPIFSSYCRDLSTASGINIDNFETLIAALTNRLDFFVSLGCKAADHGINDLPDFEKRSRVDLDRILRNGQDGVPVPKQDEADFKAAVLIELGVAYRERGVVMQYHIGALRNQNTALFNALGPDVGGDSINDALIAAPLNALMDQINLRNGLPRTILYSLNPACNELLVTIAGNFQDGSEPGKIQAGPAWWFHDQLDGMERQMTQVAQMGLLSRFVGMLTDSRSFLSFPRHEYYRRLVCRIVGRWSAEGAVPDDQALTGGLIRRICYENARDWFVPKSG